MIKKIIPYILILIISIFTGCTTKIDFQENLVLHDLNQNLEKVKSRQVNIIKNNTSLVRSPTTMAGGVHKSIIESDLNEKILKSLLSQYFENIDITTNENSFLVINSKIIDFQYKNIMVPSSGREAILTISIVVKKENKIILDKTYKETISEGNIIFSLKGFVPDDLNSQLFHRIFLKFYNNYFKPDLLKALEENK